MKEGNTRTLDISRLAKLFNHWSIKTEACPKRFDGEWRVRYTWEAEKLFEPDQGHLLGSEWEGFATSDEMLGNMIQTLEKADLRNQPIKP